MCHDFARSGKGQWRGPPGITNLAGVARARRDREAGIFHVTCHSVWSTGLFLDEFDYAAFRKLLARTVTDHRWRCCAVVLMPNHYHLILEVDDDALPVGMQRLNCAYARGFNRRYRLRGHVFGARYDAPRIDTELYFLRCCRYVYRNPVKAGLVASPQDWQQSSYAGTVGLAPQAFDFVDASPILQLFGTGQAAIDRLRALVEGD